MEEMIIIVSSSSGSGSGNGSWSKDIIVNQMEEEAAHTHTTRKKSQVFCFRLKNQLNCDFPKGERMPFKPNIRKWMEEDEKNERANRTNFFPFSVSFNFIQATTFNATEMQMQFCECNHFRENWKLCFRSPFAPREFGSFVLIQLRMHFMELTISGKRNSCSPRNSIELSGLGGCKTNTLWSISQSGVCLF